MRWYQFKYIDHTPLWNIQKDDEYQQITLPIALFGMLTQFFFNIILIMSWFNKEILIRVNQHPTQLNSYLRNEIILIPISFLFSLINILLFKLYSSTFNHHNFITQFKNQVELLQETFMLDDKIQNKYNAARRSLIKELTIVFLLGLVAGFYYSVFYFIYYLMLYFFLLFLFINIATFSVTVTISMLFSWMIMSIYLVSKKLKVEEIETRNLNPHADYRLTNRSFEIIKSNLPPIICTGCRSYISASSIICQVCGDTVVGNST